MAYKKPTYQKIENEEPLAFATPFIVVIAGAAAALVAKAIDPPNT
jgi:hypothetical protein